MEITKPTLFICETDSDDRQFARVYDQAYDEYLKHGNKDSWPLILPVCASASIMWFEPKYSAYNIYMNDPIFSIVMEVYNSRKSDMPPDMKNYCENLFGCSVSDNGLLLNSIKFLNECPFTTLPTMIKQATMDAGGIRGGI